MQILREGKKDADLMNNTPQKREPTDWSKNITSVVRLGSAIASTSAAMDALITNFQSGNITFTSFLSSISSIGFGLINMGNQLKTLVPTT